MYSTHNNTVVYTTQYSTLTRVWIRIIMASITQREQWEQTIFISRTKVIEGAVIL